jgi:Skp family chaperone for outer membrane proteins
MDFSKDNEFLKPATDIYRNRIIEEQKLGWTTLIVGIASRRDVEEFKRNLNKRTFEERENISKKLDPIIAQIANKLGASLVIQDCAYLKPEFDITSDAVAVLNQEKVIEQITFRSNIKVPIKIYFINREEVFKNFEDIEVIRKISEAERFEIRAKIAVKADTFIRAFAEKNGVAIIAQDVVAGYKGYDISPEIISLMRGSVNLNTSK